MTTTTTKTCDDIRTEIQNVMRHSWPQFRAWLLEQNKVYLGNAMNCPTARFLRSLGYAVEAVYYDTVNVNVDGEPSMVETNAPIINGRVVNYHSIAESIPDGRTVSGADLVEMIEDRACDFRVATAEEMAEHARHIEALNPKPEPEPQAGEQASPLTLAMSAFNEALLEAAKQAVEGSINAAIEWARDGIRDAVQEAIEEELKNATGDLDVSQEVENAVDDSVRYYLRDLDVDVSDEVDNAVERTINDYDFESKVEDAVENALNDYDFDLERKVEDEMENVDVEDKVRDAIRSALRSLSEDL